MKSRWERPWALALQARTCVRICAMLGVGLVLLVGSLSADEQPPKFTSEQLEFFNRDVKPLLAANCFNCHGGKEGESPKGKLWLTSRPGLLLGGDSGPALDVDNPSESLLLSAINYDSFEMPPKGKLPADKIAVLERWVKMGAPWPPGDGPSAEELAKLNSKKITAEDRNWWAYRELKQPAVPQVQAQAWVKNPIDAFIAAKLEKAGLQPSSPADKISLIRRVYYDLIGLPPTPADVDRFVHDNSPQAYANLIDRLLDSPQYGEKWGRHWLDLVRFAETNGYERDSTKPFAWRYRDYVIQSFNDDKPYDRFLIEQLAGDELDDANVETYAATGYYRLGIWDDEPADRKLAKYDYLDGVVSTTAQVMMGVTIGCARCHDHKADPILQKDYYQMLAFFENITWSMRDQPTRKFQEPNAAQDYARKKAEYDQQIAELDSEVRAFRTELITAMKKAGMPEPSDNPLGLALVADSRKQGQTWRYTTTRPAEDWAGPGFDANSWKEGVGGFGTKGTPGSVVRTTWNSREIWLRKQFRLDSIPRSLFLELHHDEDCEIYLNGVKIHEVKGYISNYKRVNLSDAAVNAAQTGKNTLAVHCRQTGGGQYIDVALLTNNGAPTYDEAVKLHAAKLLGNDRLTAHRTAKTKLETLRRSPPRNSSGGETVLCIAERGNVTTHVFGRGNPHIVGEQVRPAVPTVLETTPTAFEDQRTKQGTSGRRLALARWITNPKNPTTSRVFVNRLWQHHFGRGIVPSSNDFGKLGLQPTHPELLDWLAAEFVARGWRIKDFHRLIMLSSTYQMSSQDTKEALAKDPANNLFWRYNMRRLTAEEVRDSILAINGALNLKMGGPSIYTKVPREILQTASRPNAAWGRSSPEDQNRRSVYVFVKRSLLEPFLNTFDSADTDNSCAVRFATTVPTQALTMLNSEFMHEQAAVFAKHLREQSDDVNEQVAIALRAAVGRKLRDGEVAENLALIEKLQKEHDVAPEKALEYFCLVVLNLNEFIYVD